MCDVPWPGQERTNKILPMLWTLVLLPRVSKSTLASSQVGVHIPLGTQPFADAATRGDCDADPAGRYHAELRPIVAAIIGSLYAAHDYGDTVVQVLARHCARTGCESMWIPCE